MENYSKMRVKCRRAHQNTRVIGLQKSESVCAISYKLICFIQPDQETGSDLSVFKDTATSVYHSEVNLHTNP